MNQELFNLYKTPSKKIDIIETYVHAEAFPLSIEFWSNGDITYTQSASSTRFDINDLEEFRNNLLQRGFTFAVTKEYK